MGRMDTVVAKLKTRESKLTENIDMLQKSEAHEGHLVTVQVVILLSLIGHMYLFPNIQVIFSSCQKNLDFLDNQLSITGPFGCRAGSSEGA